MRLEVGKSYRNAFGQIRKIVSYTGRTSYPYLDNEGSTYTQRGKHMTDQDSELDLVEEIEIADGSHITPTLTKLELFAAAALAGYVTKSVSPQSAASCAVLAAEALIKELENTNGN